MLQEQVVRFLDGIEARMGHFDWEATLGALHLDYAGDVHSKGVELTWKQVSAGLPTLGVCGSVCAVERSSPALRPFLLDPWLSVKPRSEWPRRFRRSIVKVKKDE